MSDPIPTDSVNLHPALRTALEKKGFETLTAVQAEVLEEACVGADLLVSAQTGSGKTVAFGMALADTILGDAATFSRADYPMALVIAPTRELALQVKRELEWLYADAGVKMASCVGGMDMQKERKALNRGAHIVVGTPGRLVDHVKRGSLDLSELKALVLDEADEMLDMGFRDELAEILNATPKSRRTLMFSATVSKPIARMATEFQTDAVRVNTISGKQQHVDIEYRALMVHRDDHENGIINVLRYYEAKNAIVFCATRAAVNRLTSRFHNRGFSVVALSGELSQKERSNALQSMRDGRARVCVATDVAARGIDLPNLDLVIHADLPKNKEGMLHRSGRTGRAGRKGVSVLIVPVKAQKKADRLLRSAGVDAIWDTPPTKKAIYERDNQRLLSDPSLNLELSEDEIAFAKVLIEQFGAETLAGAFVRGFRAGNTAPEELRNVGDSPERKNTRQGFDDSQWFKIPRGRTGDMVPKVILNLLIDIAGLNKKDIGTIKIAADETFVEINRKNLDILVSSLDENSSIDGDVFEALEGRPQNVDTRMPDGGRGRNDRGRSRGRDRDDRGDRGDRNRNDRGRSKSRDGKTRDGKSGGGKDWGPKDRRPKSDKHGEGRKDNYRDSKRDDHHDNRSETSSFEDQGSASLYDPSAWDDGGSAKPRKSGKPPYSGKKSYDSKSSGGKFEGKPKDGSKKGDKSKKQKKKSLAKDKSTRSRNSSGPSGGSKPGGAPLKRKKRAAPRD